MVQLGANYAHVARILNCTKVMITRLIQHYRVTGRTCVVQQLFAANNVNVLPLPDLSPIEHLWDHLGQRIQRRANPPMNRDQLVQVLRWEWRVIPDAIIRHLTNSVRRRVHACILAHGGHTRHWNMFFVVKCIHICYEWSYMKSHISFLVLLWTVIL